MGDVPWSAWFLSTANVNAAGLRGMRCFFVRDLEAALVVCMFVFMYGYMYVRQAVMCSSPSMSGAAAACTRRLCS